MLFWVSFQAMKLSPRDGMVEGTRDELIDEMKRQVEGWAHYENWKLADQASEALEDLRDGCTSVRVGMTVYDVTADT